MKRGLGGINLVEVQKNRVWWLHGGCEAQSNFVINCFREVRVAYLRFMLSRRGRII